MSATSENASIATGSRLGFPPLILLLLGLAGLFEVVDRIVFSTATDAIKEELHLSDMAMGLLSGTAFSLLNCVAMLPLAVLCDRGAAARLLGAGVMLWSLGTAAAGRAGGAATLVLARMGLGLGSAASTPAVSVLAAAHTTPASRATGFSVSGAVSTAGYVIGFAGGGWAVAHLGWRSTFATVGLAGVPVALLLWLFVREPQARPEAAGDASMLALLRNRDLRELLLFGVTNALVAFPWDVWVASFYQRSFDMTAEEAGIALSLGYAVPAVAGTLAGGWIADWLARRTGQGLATRMRFAFVTFLLAVPFAVAQVMSRSFAVSLVMLVINNFMAALTVGPTDAAASTVVPPRQRGRAMAILSVCCVAVGLGIGPPLVGGISDLLQPSFGTDSLRMSLVFSSVLQLWPAFHLWQLQRRLRAREA